MIIMLVNRGKEMSKMKVLRKQKGLRQLDLAKKADVSLTWIWALENGFDGRVSIEVKKRVASALDSDVKKVFSD